MLISLYSTEGICNDSRVSLRSSLFSSLPTSEMPVDECARQDKDALSRRSNDRVLTRLLGKT